MEFFLLIIIIVILILQNSKYKRENNLSNQQINILHDKLNSILKKQTTAARTAFEKQSVKEAIKETIAPPPKDSLKETSLQEELSIPLVTKEEKPVEIVKATASVKTIMTAAPTKKATHQPAPSIWVRFKQRNPDLEKFIGENLINKIGILILVLGISYFVKFAIDKNWINEPARVGIGILVGSRAVYSS